MKNCYDKTLSQEVKERMYHKRLLRKQTLYPRYCAKVWGKEQVLHYGQNLKGNGSLLQRSKGGKKRTRYNFSPYRANKKDYEPEKGGIYEETSRKDCMDEEE